MRKFAVLCLAAVLPLAAQHEKEGKKSRHPFIGDQKAIDAGQKIFANGCGACHGAEGQGGRGPNLRSRVMWHPLDDETLYNAIQKGIGGAMPPANLPEDQAWQVVAFVRSLTSPAIENKVSGDAKAGEQLFWGTAGCSGCHRIGGRGGAMGPDLSNIGGMQSATMIRESIVDPDADGAPGHRAVTAVMKDGRTLKGVARNRTNYSMQVLDAQGNLHLVQMADVTALTIGRGSPMPKDYAKRLSRQDLQNIVAYLSRQSTRPVADAKSSTE
jgi:cytochrome c oxidase cbb3-type subunit III